MKISNPNSNVIAFVILFELFVLLYLVLSLNLVYL